MYMNRMAFFTPHMKRVFLASLSRWPAATLATEHDRYERELTQLKTILSVTQTEPPNQSKEPDSVHTFNDTDEEHVRAIVMGTMW
jgi:hypothetical protein